MTTNDDDFTSELTDAINLILEARGTAFVPAGTASGNRGMIFWLGGSIEGHPIRFDFYAPAVVEEGTHVVWAFDPRTKNQIGGSSSPDDFSDALEQLDWPNLLGALTH